MSHIVDASITPKAAARLLVSGEINLNTNWTQDVAINMLNEILELPMSCILYIVDHNIYGEVADIKYIPQFGKLDNVLRVPYYFIDKGQPCADYPQMGLYLKNDINATLDANTKFGENHGKAASLLSIVNFRNKRFIPSPLSNAFCTLAYEQQKQVAEKLLFKIPIVQIILKSAKAPVNGYASMCQLKESTRCRRSQCLRSIFKIMQSYNNPDLNLRVNNIIWDA